MNLDITGILAVLRSHAEASGLFDAVNDHEPKSAPGNGITAAIVWAGTTPASGRSGLATVSARVGFLIRIFSNMLAEPQDDIDPNLSAAVDALFTAYVGDFDLGGTASNVDIFGAHGQGLSAQPGYVSVDNKLYRIADITLPVIVNNVWTEAA